MKKILIVLLAMVLLLAGCGKNGASSPQSPSDESVTDQQEPSSSETEISSEDHAIPVSYMSRMDGRNLRSILLIRRFSI